MPASPQDLSPKEGIIFVTLRWTASYFATSFARRGDQNYTVYCNWGLTKLIRSRIMYLFFKEIFLFTKPNILLSLPAASLHCCEQFEFESLYAFKFHIAHFVIIFSVSCSHLKKMLFVNVKSAFPTYNTILRFYASHPVGFACRCLRLPSFPF